MKIWDKLDEVIGVVALTGIACFAMNIGYNGGVVSVAVAGIIALLAVKAKGGNGGGGSPSVAR